ncbi:MAG: hypothetical protein ACK5Y2_04595 [Bdellovibrionales bacterium]
MFRFRFQSLFVLLMLMASSLWAQAETTHPWDAFTGCYTTLSVNGKPVAEKDPRVNYSRFRTKINSVLLSLDRESLPTFEVSVFLEVSDEAIPGLPSGPWRVLQVLGANFSGRYSQEGGTWIYEEEGLFRTIFDLERPVRVHQRIRLTPLEDQRLQVELYQKTRDLEGRPTEISDIQGTYEVRRCQ